MALDDIPATALLLARQVPRIDMRAHILMGLKGAETVALLWGVLAATIGGAIWLVALIFWQRRRALARQLALEERTNAELEHRVAERTRQLSAEVDERRAAEMALREAQDNLVQAGKLSALGQMSAGISHELNQPLAAIESYAENAEILLGRGDGDAVGHNLGQIAQLAGRMGRIIRNLRAFSRKEGEPAVAVDIVAVVNDALVIAASRLKAEGVALDWDATRTPLVVSGGRVRLQQVVVNLISNAMDAMAGCDRARRIEISVAEDGDTVLLRVRDTGPGLIDPDRMFEPFFTTKTVGHDDGLGLGLSISYGIVQSFGGEITGANHKDGGAMFTVTLTRPAMREAAE